MTSYRNSVCDPFNPRTKVDHCAEAMLDILTANTNVRVYSSDLRAQVAARNADPALIPYARKALQNIGYAVVVHKARHLSWYKLAGTPSEYEDQRQNIVRELYSRQVTFCREMAGAVLLMPNDPLMLMTSQQATISALNLGTDVAVGMTIPEVLADVAPL